VYSVDTLVVSVHWVVAVLFNKKPYSLQMSSQ